MAVCQTDRYRCLALLVSSYRVRCLSREGYTNLDSPPPAA
jgi:hypothetical protein